VTATVRAARPWAVRALDAALGPWVRRRRAGWLAADALVAEARRRTAIAAGSLAAVEPALAVLLDEVAGLDLSPTGVIAVRETLLRALGNRLAIERARATSPAAAATRPPLLVITGLHRTGTTLLQHRLARDPRRTSPAFWELLAPAARQGGASRGRLRRQARGALLASRIATPEMRTVHPVAVDGPDECWALFLNHLAVLSFWQNLGLAAYGRWLLAQDLAPAYADYADQLGLLLAGRGAPAGPAPRQLVVKCPEHLWFLDVLARTLPDARIVWLHRDPARCAASHASLIALNQRVLHGRFDPRAVGAHATAMTVEGLRRARSALDVVPRDRVLHVRYDELVADLEGVVARIDAWSGIEPGPREAAAPLRQPAHRYDAHVLGIDAGALRERCRGYLDAFPVAEA
jgi:hypothetical protein